MEIVEVRSIIFRSCSGRWRRLLEKFRVPGDDGFTSLCLWLKLGKLVHIDKSIVFWLGTIHIA